MISRRFLPGLISLAATVSLTMGQPVRAQEAAPFDLPGPGLRVTVQRGGATLPIGSVPALSAGDVLNIHADLPKDQGAKFLMLSAFLRGATNPPPEKWLNVAETWERKNNTLSLTVPEGAKQLVLFLVPDTGGAADVIADVVRGRPGEFVRATQSLNQASLDRSRLDAFISAIQAQANTHPEALKTIAPVLARSLSIRLHASCLDQVMQLQASCLLQNRDSLVLPDMRARSATAAIAGASTDLALQVSQTREAGFGTYSPYIGVIRDVARIFGLFSSPQFSYLPTIGVREEDRVALLLNAAPSFEKPKSVLVAGMPGVEAEQPPQLRSLQTEPICAARTDAVLPLDGTALIYSTGYARNMALKISSATGEAIDLPVRARADKGGYVLARSPATDAAPGGSVKARLHGFWGFRPFDGPEFLLQFPAKEPPRIAGDGQPLALGGDNPVTLQGLAPSCVESITLRQGPSLNMPIKWNVSGDNLALTLPLHNAQPGDLTLEIRQYGLNEPLKVRVPTAATSIPLPAEPNAPADAPPA